MWYTVTFSACLRERPGQLPERYSAVTSVGYELALGGSKTCNIWLSGILQDFLGMLQLFLKNYLGILTKLFKNFHSEENTITVLGIFEELLRINVGLLRIHEELFKNFQG